MTGMVENSWSSSRGLTLAGCKLLKTALYGESMSNRSERPRRDIGGEGRCGKQAAGAAGALKLRRYSTTGTALKVPNDLGTSKLVPNSC